MKSLRFKLASLFFGAAVAVTLISSVQPVGALVTQSYHKNALWSSAQVSQSWHGYGYSEEALDLKDPGCSSLGNCKTAYFRYQGLNQYSAQYTVTDYAITSTCTGRYYTVNYYSGGLWRPLIRMAYVHLQSMRAPSSGVYYSLGYNQELNEWVGAVASSQAANCDWSGPHLHYARSTNYGTNAKNGAAGFGALNSWVGTDEVTFVASAP